MNFKVVMEPKIEAHDPQLYRADRLAEGVGSWGEVDDKQVEFYRRNGYLLVREGYSPDEVSRTLEELHRMERAEDPECDSIYYEGAIRDEVQAIATADPETSDQFKQQKLAMGDISDRLPELPPESRARYVRKLMGFVKRHPQLAEVAEKPELLEVVTRLLGEPIRLFQDMAMVKPPGGREKPWHQDHAYFNLTLDTPVLGVWIALGSATLENGCMHFLAGGHRPGPRLHFMKRDWQLCDTDLEPEVQTAAPMEAGDVLIFDSKLPHGTPTNHTQSQRWAIQFHYVAASAIETDEDERLKVFGAEGKGVSC